MERLCTSTSSLQHGRRHSQASPPSAAGCCTRRRCPPAGSAAPPPRRQAAAGSKRVKPLRAASEAWAAESEVADSSAPAGQRPTTLCLSCTLLHALRPLQGAPACSPCTALLLVLPVVLQACRPPSSGCWRPLRARSVEERRAPCSGGWWRRRRQAPCIALCPTASLTASGATGVLQASCGASLISRSHTFQIYPSPDHQSHVPPVSNTPMCTPGCACPAAGGGGGPHQQQRRRQWRGL